MKRKIRWALTFAFLAMLQVNLHAQCNQEAKTLFGSGNPVSIKDLGFFVAPSFGLTQMDGSTTSLFNLRGGFNLKGKVTIGAYFNTSRPLHE